MTWTPIAEFPTYTLCRRTQRVKSHRGNRVLKPAIDKRGRVWIRLYRDGVQYNIKLAHLMLKTFVSDPTPGQVARHLDDDPANNQLGNLRWGTQAENMQDKVRNGLHWNTNKTQCKSGHEFNAENTGMRAGRNGRYCRKCAARRAREKRHQSGSRAA